MRIHETDRYAKYGVERTGARRHTASGRPNRDQARDRKALASVGDGFRGVVTEWQCNGGRDRDRGKEGYVMGSGTVTLEESDKIGYNGGLIDVGVRTVYCYMKWGFRAEGIKRCAICRATEARLQRDGFIMERKGQNVIDMWGYTDGERDYNTSAGGRLCVTTQGPF